MSETMRSALFVEPGRIALEDKPIPDVGSNDALIRITTTTICGTDVHILKGEYPLAKGLTVGHEPVGVVEKLGRNVQRCQEGQRVIAGAICPSGPSNACLDGLYAQDGQDSAHGLKPMGAGALATALRPSPRARSLSRLRHDKKDVEDLRSRGANGVRP